MEVECVFDSGAVSAVVDEYPHRNLLLNGADEFGVELGAC